jgi:hypothetical protein
MAERGLKRLIQAISVDGLQPNVDYISFFISVLTYNSNNGYISDDDEIFILDFVSSGGLGLVSGWLEFFAPLDTFFSTFTSIFRIAEIVTNYYIGMRTYIS